MGVDHIILARVACCAIGEAADLAPLAFSVQKNLERGVLSERRLLDKVDEDRPGALAAHLDDPSLTTRASAPFGRAAASDQLDLTGNDRTERGMSDDWRWLRRRTSRPTPSLLLGG